NHQSADQNAFVINAGGERLAIESGYFNEHGAPYNSRHWQYWVKRTKSKNAITFDGGKGQIAYEHQPTPFRFENFHYGSIIQQESTPRYDIVTGDATDAYNGALTRAVRSLVYLRPGAILVYDDLASATARTWEWNIHALNPFEVISSESRVRIAGGTQSLCIDMLAGPPRQFTPISVPDYSSWGRSNDAMNDVSAAPSDPGAAAQYHGKFASTERSTAAEFIALLRVNGECSGVAPEAARKRNGAWTVQVGDSTVTFTPASKRHVARVRMDRSAAGSARLRRAADRDGAVDAFDATP
ncbi:MAG: heparinase II/III domain-containing protein, partial [Opitutaceae bacterium]